MTATSHTTTDRAAFVLAALEWLDQREQRLDPEGVDAAFDLLSSERRRQFLSVMTTHEEALTLPDVAEEVAVRETGEPVTELSAECVADVYISLYHDHLPRLVDAGLVAYDQERDLVRPTAVREQ
ncbi:hypothetical protein C483_13678 [Natrialba hulunbeirensis JCM 10989]|uniref:DUF7344 domain-containing protein n=1 Tax=Natrialba hulunbeirensis JCM 10989 TaxID=1227493 RepID=L9ZT05_9EURY|nr:hypothetical protein [Natrialba hulunbeirensis]ELY89580.1 hypothetical protein C483_13678 [Natrialba hulunbeirensis JCM 10989]